MVIKWWNTCSSSDWEAVLHEESEHFHNLLSIMTNYSHAKQLSIAADQHDILFLWPPQKELGHLSALGSTAKVKLCKSIKKNSSLENNSWIIVLWLLLVPRRCYSSFGFGSWVLSEVVTCMQKSSWFHSHNISITLLGKDLTVMSCLWSLCLRIIISSALLALFWTTATILQFWKRVFKSPFISFTKPLSWGNKRSMCITSKWDSHVIWSLQQDNPVH